MGKKETQNTAREGKVAFHAEGVGRTPSPRAGLCDEEEDGAAFRPEAAKQREARAGEQRLSDGTASRGKPLGVGLGLGPTRVAHGKCECLDFCPASSRLFLIFFTLFFLRGERAEDDDDDSHCSAACLFIQTLLCCADRPGGLIMDCTFFMRQE